MAKKGKKLTKKHKRKIGEANVIAWKGKRPSEKSIQALK